MLTLDFFKALITHTMGVLSGLKSELVELKTENAALREQLANALLDDIADDDAIDVAAKAAAAAIDALKTTQAELMASEAAKAALMEQLANAPNTAGLDELGQMLASAVGYQQ